MFSIVPSKKEKLGKSDKSSSAFSASSVDEEKESHKIVMANVSRVMNVREEPSEDATKVGVLYKDCGGKLLDRQDGWSKPGFGWSERQAEIR